jgi:hypothetical protein
MQTERINSASLMLTINLARRQWCGVAQYGAAWLRMVRRGSVGSASASCKAGWSSTLGSAPQGGLSH